MFGLALLPPKLQKQNVFFQELLSVKTTQMLDFANFHSQGALAQQMTYGWLMAVQKEEYV